MPQPRQTRPLGWQLEHSGGQDVIRLEGDWLGQAGPMPSLAAPALAGTGPVRFEAAGLGHWDSGLIAFLWDAKCAAAADGRTLELVGLPPAAGKLLALLPDEVVVAGGLARRRFRPLDWLGGRSVAVLDELGVLSVLVATVLRGGVLAIRGRARMRTADLWANIGAAGPSALMIVSVVNVLIGAILAFVGAVQLRRFAADMYVADLVALALVREMAAVMTAIVMAGRTGGAYAARIATMQGNEEIDALTVLGIPVSDYIVLPAVLALVFTMPFLYLYGCLVGMLGGFIVSIGMLNVTGAGYLDQTLQALSFGQFAFGFSKSIAFAVMIGVTSCRIGLRAGRSAADVGTATTRAVVVGIVGVIALDAVFAVVADLLGI